MSSNSHAGLRPPNEIEDCLGTPAELERAMSNGVSSSSNGCGRFRNASMASAVTVVGAADGIDDASDFIKTLADLSGQRLPGSAGPSERRFRDYRSYDAAPAKHLGQGDG